MDARIIQSITAHVQTMQHENTQGPKFKSPATFALEAITKETLNPGSDIQFHYTPTATSQDLTAQWTDATGIRQTANISQLLRDGVDFSQFIISPTEFMHYEGFINVRQVGYDFRPEGNTALFFNTKEQESGLITPITEVNLAEKMAINIYSGPAYEHMNAFLRSHGSHNVSIITHEDRTVTTNLTDHVKAILLTTAIATQGLMHTPRNLSFYKMQLTNLPYQKILDPLTGQPIIEHFSASSALMRADRLPPGQHTRNSFLRNRLDKMIPVDQTGFVSTSAYQAGSSFTPAGQGQLVYTYIEEEHNGRYIRMWSRYPSEHEFLFHPNSRFIDIYEHLEPARPGTEETVYLYQKQVQGAGEVMMQRPTLPIYTTLSNYVCPVYQHSPASNPYTLFAHQTRPATENYIHYANSAPLYQSPAP